MPVRLAFLRNREERRHEGDSQSADHASFRGKKSFQYLVHERGGDLNVPSGCTGGYDLPEKSHGGDDGKDQCVVIGHVAYPEARFVQYAFERASISRLPPVSLPTSRIRAAGGSLREARTLAMIERLAENHQ